MLQLVVARVRARDWPPYLEGLESVRLIQKGSALRDRKEVVWTEGEG